MSVFYYRWFYFSILFTFSLAQLSAPVMGDMCLATPSARYTIEKSIRKILQEEHSEGSQRNTKGMSRRRFLKSMVIGGAVIGGGGSLLINTEEEVRADVNSDNAEYVTVDPKNDFIDLKEFSKDFNVPEDNIYILELYIAEIIYKYCSNRGYKIDTKRKIAYTKNYRYIQHKRRFYNIQISIPIESKDSRKNLSYIVYYHQNEFKGRDHIMIFNEQEYIEVLGWPKIAGSVRFDGRFWRDLMRDYDHGRGVVANAEEGKMYVQHLRQLEKQKSRKILYVKLSGIGLLFSGIRGIDKFIQEREDQITQEKLKSIQLHLDKLRLEDGAKIMGKIALYILKQLAENKGTVDIPMMMIEEGKIAKFISGPRHVPWVKKTIAEMNTLYQMDLDEDLAWFAFAYYYKVLQKKGGVSILTARDGIKEFLLELTRSLPQDEQAYALFYALSDAEPEPIEKLHLVSAIAESS